MLEIINLKELTDSEIKDIKTVASTHLKKIRMKTSDDFTVLLHVKKHDDKGDKDKTKKYSIHARLEADRTDLGVKAADWDLKKVTHQVLEKLQNRIKHKFKRDTSYKKPYAR